MGGGGRCSKEHKLYEMIQEYKGEYKGLYWRQDLIWMDHHTEKESTDPGFLNQ